MINRQILEKVAIRVIELINEQIENGVDIENIKYSYSTSPFVRPLSPKHFAKVKRAVKDDKANIFTTKKGSKWVFIKGGYKDYRRIIGRDPDGDFLQDTGKMLASLNYSINHNEIQVTFSSTEDAQKAYWLNVAGVGKSKKKWKFLGLNENSKQKLIEEFSNLIVKDFIENQIKKGEINGLGK